MDRFQCSKKTPSGDTYLGNLWILRLVVNCGELKTDTPLQCGLRAPHHGIRGKIVVGLVLRICTYFRNLKFVFSVLICSSSVFCILALGSGQRLLYRVGSGLGLVLVLVLRFCAYSDGGVAYILIMCPKIVTSCVLCTVGYIM